MIVFYSNNVTWNVSVFFYSIDAFHLICIRCRYCESDSSASNHSFYLQYRSFYRSRAPTEDMHISTLIAFYSNTVTWNVSVLHHRRIPSHQYHPDWITVLWRRLQCFEPFLRQYRPFFWYRALIEDFCTFQL